ncbi:MAG: hypothetical protein KDI61_07435 [Alphaproteobacteria bacterium]|nr:hypothetical protein [Alphaproteobacteria bacterium]MCB1840077.1 hypothetical protein [Alphaproteobacteria bacterium]
MPKRRTTGLIKGLFFAAGLFILCAPAYADPAEVPDNAVQQYLSEEMKTVPDGVYIPYPEEVQEFKNSPLYKFMEKLAPDSQTTSPPSGGGCGINRKLLESV